MRIFSDYNADGAGKLPLDAAADGRERIRVNLSQVGATIALASARGGVGKSVLAVNIAAALALKGKKVAIVDADLNSPSVAAMLGMKPSRNFPMVEGIEPAAGPHGLRMVSSAQLSGGEAPAINVAPDYDQDGQSRGPAVVAIPTPALLSYSGALHRILGQTQF